MNSPKEYDKLLETIYQAVLGENDWSLKKVKKGGNKIQQLSADEAVLIIATQIS